MIIDTNTNVFCSIANPGADLTGVLYNEIISALKVNGLYLPTTCMNVEEAFNGAKSLGFSGVSVSMPYKKKIMEYVDSIDEKAKAIGAVNTVVRNDEVWKGFNTDWYGAVEAIKEKTEIKDKNILLLGAGGAARAIAYAIVNERGNLLIHNRTESSGYSLAEEFGCEYVSKQDIISNNNFDIVINATSIGFMGNNNSGDFIPRSVIKEGQVVLDIVFSPIETKFLKDAASLGAIAIPGYKMLIYQAILQFKLWLSMELTDYSLVESALVKFIEEKGL